MYSKSTIRSYRLFIVIALGSLPLWLSAQSDSSAFRIKGFVDTYHAVRSQSPHNFMSSRTRVRGEVAGDMGNSTLFVSFNATYNSLLKERTGFDLREAYLDYRDSNWGARLGRQLVIWGAADGVRITDLVSPMDMTEFLAQDYDDIRLPVNALRLFFFNDKVKLELVGVPVFQGFILPTDSANPWNILPKDTPLPVKWNDNHSRPAMKISNMEYGGRLSFNLPGIDFAFAALHTWNKMPVMQPEVTPREVKINPRYYRMGFVGGDFSKPLGEFVIRGEVAFNIGKHFSYKPEAMSMAQKGFNTVNWLVGMDWYAPAEWMLMAQLSSESIFGYEPYVAQSHHSTLFTLNVSKKLLNSTLQLSDFTYIDLNYGGWFSRFAADYALSDPIHVSLGYDWFGGNKGMFGMYSKNSEAWIKAKYSF
ncbi:DUF1302 family protein [Porphyromonas pogonae]|uniref:DUF1302 family protein n=1 Tax=Porphyromonas pogonae TaxID=867595 RepID=UPI002E763C23|nr:DUF1302 family protein [Porphyromonas pogonae]